MSIDPELNYCQCGYTFHITSWQRMRMLLHGDLIITCPQCHNRMTFRLIHHTVKVNTESIKDKGRIWRNG